MRSESFKEKQPDFLITMYDTYNREIDRHFGFAWQAVSVFAASIVTILTSTKSISGVPSYVGLCLYLILIAWALDMIIDAYFWYNRNLVVIANIERQFLDQQDARKIHYYFLSHRKKNRPITFFANLLLFLIVTPLAVIAFYFWIPSTQHDSAFYHHFRSYIPLLVLVTVVLTTRASAERRNLHYAEFLRESPGTDKGFSPQTVEHAFSKSTGLGLVSSAVTALQNSILSALGIQM